MNLTNKEELRKQGMIIEQMVEMYENQDTLREMSARSGSIIDRAQQMATLAAEIRTQKAFIDGFKYASRWSDEIWEKTNQMASDISWSRNRVCVESLNN